MLKIVHNELEMHGAQFFKSFAGILSGPVALFTSLFRYVVTLTVVVAFVAVKVGLSNENIIETTLENIYFLIYKIGLHDQK